MAMIRVFFPMLLLALAPAARATAVPVCAGLPVVAALVKDCSQNTLFVQAGQACLLSVQSQILSTQAQLSSAMIAAAAASASAQESQIQASTANIQSMRDSVNSLLAQAALARASMVLFAQNFVLPGPTTASEARTLGLTNFLSSFPCFSDNQNSLAAQAASLDQEIADLQRASVAAGVINASTQNLGGSLSSMNVASSKAGSGISGSSPTPDSGVSGSVAAEKDFAGTGSKDLSKNLAKAAAETSTLENPAVVSPNGRSDSLSDADISALNMTSGVHEGTVTANEVVRSLVKGEPQRLGQERKSAEAASTASSVSGTGGEASRATASAIASPVFRSAPPILELGEPDVALFERVHRVLRPHRR